MEKRLLTEAERLLDSRHQSKRRTLVIRGLALLVVLATISALIMPAITMSTEVECGLEEHHHTEECYAAQQVPPQPVMVCTEGQSGETVIHSHDGLCYDSQGNLICTLPEVEAHTHGPDCYQEHRTLTCQEPVDPGHQHSAACYSYVKVESAAADMAAPAAASEYICGMQEGEGAHRHTEECYPEERAAEPVCGREESEDEYDEVGNLVRQGHRHTEECWMVRVREKLVCGQEESEDEYDGEGNLIRQGHHHDGSCWLQGDELCFQYGCRQHESAGHQHTDACVQAVAQESIRVDAQGEQWEQTLVCQEQERESGHVHTDECYEITQVLACRLPELEAHTHGGECYDENGALICQKPEVKAHQHTEACFSTPEGGPVETQVLICGKEEHTHTDECRMNLPAETEKFYCGMAEHLHSKEKNCYFPSGELKCTLPEHTHTDECMVPPSERPQMSDPVELEVDRTFEWEAAPYRMTIRVTGTAVIPGQPVMVVEEPEVPMADQPLLGGFLSLFTSFLSTASATDVEIDEPEAGAAAPEPTAAVDGSQGAYEPELYSQEEGIVDAGQEPGGSSDAEDGVEIQPADAPDPGRIEFSVETVSQWDEGYRSVAEEVEASGESPEDLTVFRVVAALDGIELDLSQCDIEVEAEIIEDEPQELDVFPAEGGEAQTWDGVEDVPEDAAEDNAPAQMSFRYSVKKARSMSAKSLSASDWAAAAEDGTDGSGQDEAATSEPEPTPDPETRRVKVFKSRKGNTRDFGVTSSDDDSGNFQFTVEFYAYLKQLDTAGEMGTDPKKLYLPLIDTTNGVMPGNGTTSPKLKYLVADVPTTLTAAKDAPDGQKGTLATLRYITELTEIFKANNEVDFYPSLEDTFTVDDVDGVKNGGMGTVFQGQDHYVRSELWIGQKGTDGKVSAWTAYTTGSQEKHPKPADGSVTVKPVASLDTIRFTNKKESEKPDDLEPTLFVNENTVIRMAYDVVEDENGVSHNDVRFYDYDITHGKETINGKNDYFTNTISDGGKVTAQGVNSQTNYQDKPGDVRFGFGNNTPKTGMEKEQWVYKDLKGKDIMNNLNMTNSTDKNGAGSYSGCTFGLVTSVDTANMKPVFAQGVSAPTELFGTTTGNGIYYYGGNSLHFDRVGDTYTLDTAMGPGGRALTNLDQFEFTSENWNKTNKIWSNNFWPLDNAVGKDPKNSYDAEKIGFGSEWLASDDGKPHNSYFGMSFTVAFTLPKDYVGPLEYYFYGDDDMWVFLEKPDGTTTLVCDIGGVHSSVGEYVNLWDYIPKTERTVNGTYSLRFFYTERGASGSTCWMQYTVPNMYMVSSPPAPATTDLRVEKQVETEKPGDLEKYKNQDFTFALTLEGVNNEYTGWVYDENNAPVLDENNQPVSYKFSGTETEFTLKHGQYLRISGLGLGTKYTVKEILPVPKEGSEETKWLAKVDSGEWQDTGPKTTGTLNAPNMVTFINTPDPAGGYQLPETGGGTRAQWYTLACAPFLAAGCLWYKKKSQGEGGGG